MPISGVVIRCRPEKALTVSETVALDGSLEVHGVLTDGQIVAAALRRRLPSNWEAASG
jgi:hypothetical protein